MVLHAHFRGPTILASSSSSSPSPSLPRCCEQWRTGLIQRRALLPSSHWFFRLRRSGIFSNSVSNPVVFQAAICRLPLAAIAAADSGSKRPNPSRDETLFLHLLDEDDEARAADKGSDRRPKTREPSGETEISETQSSDNVHNFADETRRYDDERLSQLLQFPLNADSRREGGSRDDLALKRERSAQKSPHSADTSAVEHQSHNPGHDKQKDRLVATEATSELTAEEGGSELFAEDSVRSRERPLLEPPIQRIAPGDEDLEDASCSDRRDEKRDFHPTAVSVKASKSVNHLEYVPDSGYFQNPLGVNSTRAKGFHTDEQEDDANFNEENFVVRRQPLKVGRQVFLSGNQDYKRWLPISRKGSQGQEITENLLPFDEDEDEEEDKDDEEDDGEEEPASENHFLVDSGFSSQNADGEDKEWESQGIQQQEEEEASAEKNPDIAGGGGGGGDLLVEFLHKRREHWGNDWFNNRRQRSAVSTPSLGKETFPYRDSEDRVTKDENSSKEGAGSRLFVAPGVPLAQDFSSEKPSSTTGEEKGQGLPAVVREVVRIAESLPVNASLETFLAPFYGRISTSDGNLALKALGGSLLTWPMLSFFQWMRVHKPTLLDSQSFSTIFTVLGKLGLVDQALRLFKNMPDDPEFHCLQVYNSLLGAIARSDRSRMVSPILQEMDRRKISRDDVTYGILINGTSRGKGKSDEVWSIFDEMLSAGVKPSVSVYGSLIKALCDEGYLRQALQVSFSMEKYGLSPNVIIYNTLIDAHGKALQLEDAEGLLLEMRKRGILPTESTYNALINAYGRNGQLDVTEELFLEMQNQGLHPDVVTYTSLISAFGKQKMSERASDVFLKMRKNGLEPTSHTYTALINAYAESGWHDKAQRTFDSMVREGLKPTIETYTALLDGYRRAGDLDMVRYVWNAIKADGCELTKVTYRTIMDAFGKYGLYVEATDVVDEFRKRGMKPDTMIYNILLNAYARGGVQTKLPKIFLEMQEAGCEPDSYTYCTLIYAHIRVRDFTKAFKYDLEMTEKGLLPEPQVYSKMKFILDAKYALKVENDKKAEAGQNPGRQKEVRKNPQRSKRNFKRYKLHGPSRGSERTRALWKDKENRSGSSNSSVR